VVGLTSPAEIYSYMVVNNLDATFAALSDPTVQMILSRLALGPATVNELSEPFEVTQQAISKHLGYLEHARLITKRRSGRQHSCALKAPPIREVADWAMGYRRFWEESYERLCATV
jgi:DNA-binding transcriptional ArsR family regulator